MLGYGERNAAVFMRAFSRDHCVVGICGWFFQPAEKGFREAIVILVEF
jgi:hypothetical protein